MQHLVSVLILSTLVLAAPTTLEGRQGISSNDLRDGCKPVIFIMARGSTEAGNMVRPYLDLFTKTFFSQQYCQGRS